MSLFFVFLTISKSKTGHFEGVLALPSCFPGTGWWEDQSSSLRTQVKSPRLVTHTCDPSTGSPAYLLGFGPREAPSQNTRCVVFLRMTHKVDFWFPHTEGGGRGREME